MYRSSADFLQSLCIAANSGNTQLCPNFNEIQIAMDLCFQKFDYVEQCSKKMEVVVRHCSVISKGTNAMYNYTFFILYSYIID